MKQLLALLCLGACLVTAFGDETTDLKERQKAFCTDPFEYVCKDAEAPLGNFKQRRLEVAKQALERALLKQRGKVSAAVERDFSRFVLKATDPVEKQKFHLAIDQRDVAPFLFLAKTYLNELEAILPIKRGHVADAVSMIKKRHLDRVARLTFLDAASRQKAIAEIENVNVLTYADLIEFFEKSGVDARRHPEEAMATYGQVVSKLSTDFLQDDARVQTITVQKTFSDNTQRSENLTLIYISPGSLLRLGEFADLDLMSSNVTIGHEIAHIYDLTKINKDRANVAGACFLNEFGKSPEMRWTSLEGREKAESFWVNFKEFLADNGAAEILATILKEKDAALTLKGLRSVKAHLQTYCLEKPGKHPSGRFRISVAFRANPIFSKYVCPGFPEPVTCTEDGRYPREK